MSFTSLQAYTSNFWYFDSGCSRHMTGDHNALINCEKCSREYITFVDGAKSHVFRKGTLNVEGFPRLEKCFTC